MICITTFYRYYLTSYIFFENKGYPMKLATYQTKDGPRVGVVHSKDNRILDLAAAAARLGGDISPFKSMLSLIDAGDAALDTARNAFDAHGKDEALSVDVANADIL